MSTTSGFLISCDKRLCVRVGYEICQRPPAHAGMRNRGQLSTTLCARRRGHSQDKPSTEANRAAQRHTEPRHTVPHGAVLFLAHAAPEQMADGRREGEKTTAVMDGRPQLKHPARTRRIAYKYIWIR